jgi:hypothetical protein
MDYRASHPQAFTLGDVPRESLYASKEYLRFRRPFALPVFVITALVAGFFGVRHGVEYATVWAVGAFVPLLLISELVALIVWRRRRRDPPGPTTARRVGGSVELATPAATTTVPLEAIRRTTLAAHGLSGPCPALSFGAAGVLACTAVLPDDWPTEHVSSEARWRVDETTFRALVATFLAEEHLPHERIEIADELEDADENAPHAARQMR